MLKNKYSFRPRGILLLLLVVVCWSAVAGAGRPGWQRRQVDWRMTGGSRIKAISYPREKPLPLLTERGKRRPRIVRKKTLGAEAASRLAPLAQEATTSVIANVVDSPPTDGFIPLVVVSITDKSANDDSNGVATPEASVVGDYPNPVNPQTDYAIGIFDTGASAHVIGNAAATQAGLFYPNPDNDLITLNTVDITGVTGSVAAWVSRPLGVFVDGLSAIKPNGLLLDNSGMVGEWNVAIAVGMGGSPNDLPTAIGSPLSVYYTTVINTEQEITVTHNNKDFNSPDIHLYEHGDPCIPDYSNIIPLELKPLGGINVQFTPWLDPEDPWGLSFCPLNPSTIVGNLLQSVLFVHGVDLYDGDKKALDKDRFMFDTGAQVSTVGSRIATRLRLDPDWPEFEVEIEGVTGDTVTAPGFYIDSVEIPAFGEWLICTNVPVVLLDVFSPEGGTVDGIIGMNLFTEFNLVFRGGGLFLQDEPTLEFESIYRIVADIVPEGGDGKVDFSDLAVFAEAWLATGAPPPPSPNWNPKCDMAPVSSPDGKVDFLDFAVFAGHWFEGT